MQYLGDYQIDSYITFGAQLHRFSSGAVYAPTGNVTYTFYENNSTTGAPTGGNLAQLNSKTGLYTARVQLTAAAGFEVGKEYLIHIEATVDSVAAAELLMFRTRAADSPQSGDVYAIVSDGRIAADVQAISGDATAADNLETMLDGTGGAALTIKKVVINNTDPTGVGVQINAYDGANVVGTNRGIKLQGGTNQALYALSDTAAATVYVEGPSTGGKGIAISSPSDGTSLPGASGIYIQTEGGHPGILFDFTDPADALKVVNSDNGAWVLDDKLFAMPADTADAVRTELAVELAHLDADVSEAGGGLTAQETRDAMKLAPTAGTPAAGSVDAHLDSLLTYGAGTGTGTYSDTVTDGADPLDNVLVQLSTDSAGTNMVYRAYTAADGTFAMYPDPGTYYVWLELAGYSFTQGAQVVVT